MKTNSSQQYVQSDKPKFFGRRKGRTIHKAKSFLLEDFLPRLLLNASENKPSYFDLNPDDVYIKMCDFLGVTCYYNHEEIEERMNDMLEKMSHSCYGM